MSNLRDFAVTLADAWERAACSISQLLTPPPGVPPRTSSSFLTVGRAMAGTSDSHLSPLTEDGVGSSCEFIPQSTLGLGDLSVFVLTSDVASKVCIGAVTGGGVKFCTRGNTCSILAYGTKVPVIIGDIYISSNKNFAYSQPHIPASLVGSSLSALLEETHPKEEWTRLFHEFYAQRPSVPQVVSALTPAKCKHCYLSPESATLDVELIRDLASWDFENLPTEDLHRISQVLKALEKRVARLSTGCL